LAEAGAGDVVADMLADGAPSRYATTEV